MKNTNQSKEKCKNCTLWISQIGGSIVRSPLGKVLMITWFSDGSYQIKEIKDV